jgi:uncharacterized membrane protein (DUF106 family)
MSIKIVSDHKETDLRKDTDLPFVPYVGMGFHYGLEVVTVKTVIYYELTNSFFLDFEDMKIKNDLFDETIDDFKEDRWTIKDQWKKK